MDLGQPLELKTVQLSSEMLGGCENIAVLELSAGRTGVSVLELWGPGLPSERAFRARYEGLLLDRRRWQLAGRMPRRGRTRGPVRLVIPNLLSSGVLFGA